MPQFPRNADSSLTPGGRLALRAGWQRLRAIFSLNDPRWGRDGQDDDKKDGRDDNRQQNQRPQQDGGPPDLDELWRDFNRRLNGLLGRKDNGGNGNQGFGGPRTSGKGPGVGAGVIVAAVVGIWLASGFFMVQEGQTAVILQFGKFKYSAGPGINWRMPWPIQSAEVVNLSAVRSVEVGRSTSIKDSNLKDSSMLTQDENIIDVRFTVQYVIQDASEFLFFNKTDRGGDEELVTQAAETSVREIVGRNKMDAVLYENREQIAQQLAKSIQAILSAYKTGIRVLSVNVQSVQPPEQVQAAFDDVNKASQDRERAISEGQAYANDIIPRAKGTAARLKEESEAYRARVVAQAEGDAARFRSVQAEYAKAPQVTRDRIYLETMQQIYTNSTKVLVDARQGNNLLYLPLDKLMAQAEGRAAPTQPGQPGAAGGTPAPAPDASTDNRSRESLRNRDRDSR
ncbi:FtsH protease activity modulator HflK [Cupriavidus taiwanensis]|uniref:Protein HflK n=2 Tax=Cupriavidus taiwanensis TaxID=164546 RepID=B3R1J4_CUPTR|nr:FtsH protease activity modulator HflK [Cupriavidus taiwanensis]CAQ69842.1 Protein hflK, cofactor of ATP-dependent protease FtsH [Cupriavidus taiwanensis LMG 19424]SOY44995.1 Protein hflK, cofactor of ATP-dependent protease FtsH [Cupriavidus taiwanensis]SOY88085.1 Protein hflK, cofactor of ATP-dependent protease FtsH [Cupriavidus taiwanensis]SOZ05743.1 Protein hflK, cofactor of ATP-dependent protease FtsH [Cupriavidus taiwanensis]SOZ07727.1 Protein hflK, cofactor of ATP-dependent protease Ft